MRGPLGRARTHLCAATTGLTRVGERKVVGGEPAVATPTALLDPIEEPLNLGSNGSRHQRKRERRCCARVGTLLLNVATDLFGKRCDQLKTRSMLVRFLDATPIVGYC